MYAAARDATGPAEERWRRFRASRERLFATHPSTPLGSNDREHFGGLPYFAYDPSARLLADAADAPGEPFALALGDDGMLRMARTAWLAFELHGRPQRLALYRLLDYGGGLLLPFRDATSGRATYGGGRYLLDTRKHADLGVEGGRLVLDFNFAYHPSCAYDPRWVCPLAPPENHLAQEVRAGERLPAHGWGASVS